MESAGRLSPGEPSAALQAAQALLAQLRMERGIRPEIRSDPPWEPNPHHPPEPDWPLINAQAELQRRREEAGVREVLSHSGETFDIIPAAHESAAPVESSSPHPPGTVIAHPTILLAILRQNLEAPARIYFLLRAIDVEGRGWLDVEDIRQQLTTKDTPLRVCGWRRLRQILKQGEGTFWQRDDQGRLWLYGAHKIAYKLDCERLQGFPVELPIQALLGGIQAVRAAFYAAFHGGRDSRPISRETLESLSGIPGRTQLEYDRVAGVQRTRNIAIGERYSQDAIQERAWNKGRAVFHFVDTKGLQGGAGREYVAWHLPNSYQAAYQRRSRGSRKRLNRKLADLVQKGIPGNDDRAVEKLFFANGALAARRYNRYPEQDAYWRQGRSTRIGDGLWWVISGLRQ